MSGARWPRRMVRLGLIGVAAMTLAVPVIQLARGTTGHDWYAARKLTAAEVMIAVGFSETTTVAFRLADGDTWNIIRAAVAVFPSAVRVRQRIVATVVDGVMVGAGVGGTVFCLMLLGAAGHRRRGRIGTALEPVEYPHRHPPTASPAGAHRGLGPARTAGADRAAGGVSGGARAPARAARPQAASRFH